MGALIVGGVLVYFLLAAVAFWLGGGGVGRKRGRS